MMPCKVSGTPAHRHNQQGAELPFCPEYREYLGLFIDLIIEISGQKGDFFWNFQFFLY